MDEDLAEPTRDQLVDEVKRLRPVVLVHRLLTELAGTHSSGSYREDQMANWQLHWLEAAGDLNPWRRQIEVEFEAAREAVSCLVRPPRLDVLVQRLAGAVIPEIGMVGHAYRSNLFALTLDPDNPHFAVCLSDGTLRRHIAHEVHHCLRMGGPGYGRTLGEALVSEGLAGHFTRRVFGNPPEPWEHAVGDDVLRAGLPDVASLASTSYDHASWFFGAGGHRPRWLGYTLGYVVVGKWLDTVADADGQVLVTTPAEIILSEGLPRLQATASSEGEHRN